VVPRDSDSFCPSSNTNNSCFSLDSLKIIANEYNKTNQDKINISNNKKELVNQLKDKFSSSCSYW
jgi:hypothetical protein